MRNLWVFIQFPPRGRFKAESSLGIQPEQAREYGTNGMLAIIYPCSVPSLTIV